MAQKRTDRGLDQAEEGEGMPSTLVVASIHSTYNSRALTLSYIPVVWQKEDTVLL